MSLKIHPSLGAEFPEVQQILRQVKEEMQRQWMQAQPEGDLIDPRLAA